MQSAYEGWAILELMGHRRLAGTVREVEFAGSKMVRIDIPSADGDVTQFYGGGAIYCLTPTTEEIARAVAKSVNAAPPVSIYELRALTAGSATHGADRHDYKTENSEQCAYDGCSSIATRTYFPDDGCVDLCDEHAPKSGATR